MNHVCLEEYRIFDGRVDIRRIADLALLSEQ